MDQLPLENFENNRIELLFCQNTLICLLLSKVGLLWGEGLTMAKGGVFDLEILAMSQCVFDLEIGN